MLLIPYSSELSLARKPYVTFAIILLCLLIHYAQDSNRREISRHLGTYCQQSAQDDDAHNPFAGYPDRCALVLGALHSSTRPEQIYESIQTELESNTELYSRDRERILESVRSQYDQFAIDAPRSLDRELMFDPATLNPIKMLTAAFAHGDWMHVIGNMIFYFAFAPALELLIGGAIRYLLVIVSIAFTTHIVYAISTMVSGDAIPTLGYSGVVTGMIGLSAFMMPNARIRSFVWFLYFVRTVYVPAWILAVWYIGLDAWQLLSEGNSGGINLIAHVSGGVAGYLIGWFFLKQRREEIKEQLDDEVENMRSQRMQRQGRTHVNTAELKRQQLERQKEMAAAEEAAFWDRLYRAVRTHRDSEAVAMAMDLFERRGETPEACEEIYREIGKWGLSRTLLCMGRLNIELQLERNRLPKALHLAAECLDHSEFFVLGNVKHLPVLVKHAIDTQDYRLAYRLLKDADERYGRTVNHLKANLNAAKLLWVYLGEREKARELVMKLKHQVGEASSAELDKFVALVKAKPG